MTNQHRSPDEAAFVLAELIRTRPAAFDFGDAPDIQPLCDEYASAMDARRPRWMKEPMKGSQED